MGLCFCSCPGLCNCEEQPCPLFFILYPTPTASWFSLHTSWYLKKKIKETPYNQLNKLHYIHVADYLGASETEWGSLIEADLGQRPRGCLKMFTGREWSAEQCERFANTCCPLPPSPSAPLTSLLFLQPAQMSPLRSVYLTVPSPAGTLAADALPSFGRLPDMPSQNMPLWNMDYYEWKAIENLQTQEKL